MKIVASLGNKVFILKLVPLLLAIGYFGAFVFLPALQRQTHGFATYYVGAWMFRQGTIGFLYDTEQFNRAMQASGVRNIFDLYDANAPLLAFVTAPMAWWSPMTARAIWLWFNLVLLIPCGWFSLKLLLPPKPALTKLSVPILILILLYAPLHENFRLGQMYLAFLVALLAMLTWNNKFLCGLALALQLIIKLYYGLFSLMFILVKPGLVVIGISLTLILAIVLMPYTGWELWQDYIGLASSFSGRPYNGVTAYQTISGLFSHLFRYEPGWNPAPVAHLPVLAEILTNVTRGIVIFISAFGLVKNGYRRGKGWRLEPEQARVQIATVFTLAPLLAPAAEEYHFTLLILPIVVSASLLLEAQRQAFGNLLLWFGAIILLTPAWNYKEVSDSGWWALIAYPRLYGALLLWVLLVRFTLACPEARSKNS